MSNTSAPDTDVGTDADIDVRAPFPGLLRRLPIAIVFAGAIGVASWFLLGQIAPVYTSGAAVLIVSGESDITRPPGSANPASLDREAIASQVQLIRSRDLARAVAAKLDLGSSAEFNPEGDSSFIGQLLAMAGIERPAPASTPEQRVLDVYYDNLSVHAVDGSRVIAIEFSSQDPDLAAAAANAIAEEYIALQRAAKRDLTADAAQWLAVQIADLRTQVQDAEARVERYRTENDLFVSVGGEAATLSQQQLSDLSAELARVRAARADAEARAAQIGPAIDAGGVPNISEVLNSALIQRLIEQQVALRAEIAQLNATPMPQHPRFRELVAQIAELDRQIAAEARKILDALEAEARLAAARESAIERNIALLKVTAADANDAAVELRALEREAAAQRDLLQSYLVRYRDAVAREEADYLPADARLVSRAAATFEPSFPQKTPMSIAAAALAAILAMAFIFLRERSSGRSRRRLSAVAEGDAGETIADAGTRWADDRSVRRMMSAAPSLVPEMPDRAEEALREIAAELVASRHKRVLVTLAEGSDTGGRPLGAVALARALARCDVRVCLVDFRSDGADAVSMGEADNLPGFGDLFAGEASFAQVIFRDRKSRVHFIPSGRHPPAAAELAGDGLETVLSALTLTYDVVLLDAADDAIPALAPSCGAAMVVSEFGPDDPRTVAAFVRIAEVSDAKPLLLVVDPAADPAPGDRETTPAGAAA